MPKRFERETSNCPECKKPGHQTDDTGAYWKCQEGHRWADIRWCFDEEEAHDWAGLS